MMTQLLMCSEFLGFYTDVVKVPGWGGAFGAFLLLLEGVVYILT